MTISPEEIETKAFVVALRGYDQTEVDRWMQDLASQHRALLSDLSANASDVFDMVGRDIAAALRAARDAAALMHARASLDIARVRDEVLAEIAAAQEARERAITRVREAAKEEIDAVIAGAHAAAQGGEPAPREPVPAL